MNVESTTRRAFTSLFKSFSAALIAFSVLVAPAAMAAKANDKTQIAQVRVSINSASAEILADALVGVGEKKAKAIVSYRKKNGKFKSVADLALVKGIGAATIEKNRAKLTL